MSRGQTIDSVIYRTHPYRLDVLPQILSPGLGAVAAGSHGRAGIAGQCGAAAMKEYCIKMVKIPLI